MVWKAGFVLLLMTSALITIAGNDKKRVCLGYYANIVCHETEKIKIVDAVYGVPDNKLRCGTRGNISITICWSREKLSLVKKLCDARPSCEFKVTKEKFGHPCPTNAGKEYLTVEFKCMQVLGPDPIQLPDQPDVFARQDKSNLAKQYLGKIKMSFSKHGNTRKPLFEIANVHNLTNISIDDEKTADRSLTDLISKENIPITSGLGECMVGKVDNPMNKYFCIYSPSGYLMMTDQAPHPLHLDTIARYQIDIQMKETSTAQLQRGSVVSNMVTKCYPIDHYYRKVKEKCSKVREYQHDALYGSSKWPHWIFSFYVKAGTILSKLRIHTSEILSDKITGKFPVGNYTIRVNLNDRYSLQHFEYETKLGGNNKQRNVFYPRVSGETFEVIFTKEISIYRTQTIQLVIRSHDEPIVGKSNNALTLYSTDKLSSCPSPGCMSVFEKWRHTYEKITKSGTLNCLNDDDMYYSALMFCDESLHVDHNDTFYFGKPFHLVCHGGRPDLNKTVWWYKDGRLLLGGEHGLDLYITATKFQQEGSYQCQITDLEGTVKSSPKVYVRFKDVIKTVFSLEIPTEQYKIFVSRGGNEFERLIKSEVSNVVLKGSHALEHDAIIQTFNSSQGWLQMKVTIHTQLKPKSSVAQFYNNFLKEEVKFGHLKIRTGSYQVLDEDMCLPSLTGISSSYGTFSWNFTKENERDEITCPYGNATATRSCSGGMTSLAKWHPPNMDKCDVGSKTTKELQSILKDFNATSGKEVSEKVKNLTSNPATITSEDTSIINTIISNIQNNSDGSIKVVEDVVGIASNLLQVNTSVLVTAHIKGNALKGIIHSVEGLCRNLEQKVNETGKLVEVSSKKLGIAVIGETQDTFSGGVLTVKTENNNLPPESFKYYKNITKTAMSDDISLKINLPPTLLNDSSSTSSSRKSLRFVYYASAALFPVVYTSGDSGHVVSQTQPLGGVFSIKVGNERSLNLSKPLQFSLRTKDEFKGQNTLQCVYWNFEANDNRGDWSDKGCRKVSSDGNTVTCSCNHLTNFAVLFSPEIKFGTTLSPANEKALSIISYIGCGLSLAGVVLTLLSIALFSFIFARYVEEYRGDPANCSSINGKVFPRFLRRAIPSKVLVGLSCSLGLLMLVFLVLVRRTQPKRLCTSTAAILHFLILSTFGWMFVEAVTLYLKIVKVMGQYTSHFMKKAAFMSLGIPGIIVMVCLLAKMEDYGRKDLCIVRGNVLKYGLFFPSCLILLCNLIIFVMVLHALYKSKSTLNKHGEKSSIYANLRIAASCCTLLGLTWLFGVLSISDARVVFQYLFCICNSFQGLFLFYFNIFRQLRVRTAWINFLSGKGRNTRDIISNTYTNGSSKLTQTKKGTSITTITTSPMSTPEITCDMRSLYTRNIEPHATPDRVQLEIRLDNSPKDTICNELTEQ